MSAERSMRDCIMEQLDRVCDALPSDLTFDEWYAEGCDFGIFVDEGQGYAWGYISGAADAVNLTVGELLDEHRINTKSARSSGPGSRAFGRAKNKRKAKP